MVGEEDMALENNTRKDKMVEYSSRKRKAASLEEGDRDNKRLRLQDSILEV